MKADLTNSRLKSARACMRLHHNQYDLGYHSAREAAAPRFGTLFHAGLEAWWRAVMSIGEVQQRCLGAAILAIAADRADPYERAKAEALLFGYHVRWSGEPYDVLAVEAKFRTPLRNPATRRASTHWTLAGKVDAIVRDRRDGLKRLLEHKTSGEDITPGSDYWRRLRIDSQISVYHDGAAALGHEVVGCIYDVIGKPTLRPGEIPLRDEAGSKIVYDANGSRVRTKDQKKWRETSDAEQGYTLQTRPETPDEYRVRLLAAISENPERYYARAEVVRLAAEMDEARADTWQTAQAIRAAEVLGAYPRNSDACLRYGRTCEFFDVCTGAASLDDPTTFVRLGASPELAGDAPTETSKEER